MKKILSLIVMIAAFVSTASAQTYAPLYGTSLSLKNGSNKTIIYPNGAGGSALTMILPTTTANNGDVLRISTPGNQLYWDAPSGGSVSNFIFTDLNGISGNVTLSTTTPTLELSLGAITPTSVSASGTLSGSNFTGSSSGTNTGDETNASIKTKLGAATTTDDGYLTSTDWNTFDGKLSAVTTTGATLSGNGTSGTPLSVAPNTSVQKVAARLNSGAEVGTRRRLNFIAGTNVTLGVTDDGVDDELDVTVATTGAATFSSLTVTGAANKLAYFDGSGNLTTAGPTSPDFTSLSTFAGGLPGQLSAAKGGTGIDGSAAANGRLLIGNGSGYTLANLTQGSGITITNGAGSITLAVPVMVQSGGSAASGLVPTPPGSAGATKFLREDATWAVPAGGGGSPTYNVLILTTSPTYTTTTMTAVTDLSVALGASENWMVEGFLRIEASADAADPKIQFDYVTGSLITDGLNIAGDCQGARGGNADNAAQPATFFWDATADIYTPNYDNNSLTGLIHFTGTVRTSTAGTFTLKLARNGASGTTTLFKGSTIKMIKY